MTNKNSMMSVKFWLVVTFKSKRRNVFEKRLNKRQVFFNILFFKMCDMYMFNQTRLRDFFQNGGFVIILFHCIVVEVLLLFPTRFILFKVRARLRTKRGKEKDPDTQRFMSFFREAFKKIFLHLGGHDQSSLHFSKTS